MGNGYSRRRASSLAWASPWGSTMDVLEVEIADAARFLTLDSEWRNLVSRAWTPNVFMEPAVVAAAESATKTRTVLVWRKLAADQERKLVGAWAFALARAA